MNCHACDSNNIAKDVPVGETGIPTGNPIFAFAVEYDQKERIRANICKDCGTVRLYVNNPKTEWDSLDPIIRETRPISNSKRREMKVMKRLFICILIMSIAVLLVNHFSPEFSPDPSILSRSVNTILLLTSAGGLFIISCLDSATE